VPREDPGEAAACYHHIASVLLLRRSLPSDPLPHLFCARRPRGSPRANDGKWGRIQLPPSRTALVTGFPGGFSTRAVFSDRLAGLLASRAEQSR
jgi:hypothetical protein